MPLQELPPGLASIAFEAPREASAGGGALPGRLHRHPWTDAQLQQVATCQRAHHLVPRDACAAADGLAQGAAADDSAAGRGNVTNGATEPVPAAAARPPAHPASVEPAVGAACGAKSGGGSDRGCGGGETGGIDGKNGAAAAAGNEADGPAADAAALSRAAAALLRVLAEAVRVRCLAADEPGTKRRAAELRQECEVCPLPLLCAAAGGLFEGNGADVCPVPSLGGVATSLHAADGGGGSGATAAEGVPPQLLNPAGRLAPAPVLVLFSGGVDSTLLAALAHKVSRETPLVKQF